MLIKTSDVSVTFMTPNRPLLEGLSLFYYIYLSLKKKKFEFQIPSCTTHSRSDQSPGLGAHRHAQWAASDQDLPGETLLAERGHAGKDAPLQPTVGTAR